ncbi:Cytosine/adenosine deaminase [Rhizobiales bacterium GAS113]|nr:Cytosine/adenosine deaminase [Rhizobiales bacterium GAS113]
MTGMNDETTIFANGLLPQIGLTDIVVGNGRITSIGKSADPTNANIVDLCGNLVLPGLVDGHMHLDKTLFGLPWMPHAAGPTRMSRIETDKEILPKLAVPARRRAALLLDRCIANGTAHVRTHVDMHLEMGLSPLLEILTAREAYEGRLTIEIVAFPQAGVMRCPGVIDLIDAALDAGADLVGGIDPSVIDRDPRGQLDAIFALADRRGVAIDIHLHEPGELGLFSLEEICARTQVLGLSGKVTISHAFCLGMVPESAARNAAELLGRSGVAIATHGAGGSIIPPILMLRDAGVNVFAGNDDVRDTWSPYGNADMLERAALIGWKSDFRRDELVAVAFDIVSAAGAKALSIEGYGIAVDNPANFFTVDASCIPEAVGGHPPRKLVVHEGKIVAREGLTV